MYLFDKKKCRAFLALLLSVAIIFTFTPTITFANGVDGDDLNSGVVSGEQSNTDSPGDSVASGGQQPAESTPVLRGEGDSQDSESSEVEEALKPIQYYYTWNVPSVFYFADEDPVPARTTQGVIPKIKREGESSYHDPEDFVEISWKVTDSAASSVEAEASSIATVDENGLVTFTKPGSVKVWLTMTDSAGTKSASKSASYKIAPAYIERDGERVAYATLLAAFNAAQDGETIVLGSDYTATNIGKMTMNKDASVTIDLNGHKVAMNQNYATNAYGAIFTVKKGTLTIKDSAGGGSVEAAGTNCRAFHMDGTGNAEASDAKLVIDKGVSVSSSKDCCVTIVGKATLETEGDLSSSADFAIAGNGSEGNGGYVINVKDGSITGEEIAIYHPNDGTLTISGGTVTGNTAIYQKAGSLNITGGTITGNGEKKEYTYNGNGANATGDAIVIDNCGYPGGVPAPAITGGTINSANASPIGSYAYPAEGEDAKEPVNGFVSGGAYNKEISQDICAEGFTCAKNADGLYEILRAMKLNPESLELYINDMGKIQVENAIDGYYYYWKYEGNAIGSGGFNGATGEGRPYGKAAGEGTATMTVYTDNTKTEQVGQPLVCNVTVKDVSARVDGTEYTVADFQNAVAAAISSGKVLEVYTDNGRVTLTEGQTLKVKAADNRGKGKVTVSAPAATATSMYVIERTTDADTGITTYTCEDKGTPNVEYTAADGTKSYSATLTLSNPGTYKLLNNFKNGRVTVNKEDVVLDLNGKTITFETGETTPAIMLGTSVRTGGLTIKDSSEDGTGAIVNSGDIGVWSANRSSKLTVEGGSITAKVSAVYTSNGSTAQITGGTFKVSGEDKNFVLNCKDDNKETITVSGGTFYGFNPADNAADGEHTNYLAEGYVVKTGQDGSETTYTVVDALQAAKEEALAELNEVDADSYVESQQYKVYKLVENAKKNVEAAKSVDEVNEIMEAFRTDLAKYKTLDQAKEDAIAALEGYKDAADYRDAEKTALAEAIEAGTSAINNAATKDAVEEALAAAKAQIDELKTAAQYEAEEAEAAANATAEALAKAKSDALTELNSYKDPADYRDAEKTALRALKSEAREAINAATTPDEVAAALAAAKDEMDGLKTAAQYEEEEATAASQALAKAKTDAITALEGYKDAADYRDAEKTALAEAIEAGTSAINNATTKEAVEEALAAAKAQIDELKTAAQYEAEEAEAAANATAEALAKAKSDALTELNSYKDPADYRDLEKTAIRAIKAETREAINAATTPDEVAAALAAAKDELDELKTAAQYEAEEAEEAATAAAQALENAKADALDALNNINPADYRDTAREGQTETDKAQVENIIDSAKAAIASATTPEQVAQILDEAATSLQQIPTNQDLTEKEDQELKDAQNAADKAIKDILAGAQDKISDADKSAAEIAAMSARLDALTATTPADAAAAAQQFTDLVNGMIEAQEAADNALASAKTDAAAALDEYISEENLAKYRDSEKQAIKDAVEEAKAAISAATTPDQVNQILSNAKSAVGAVKTDAQLTQEEAATKPTKPATTKPTTATTPKKTSSTTAKKTKSAAAAEKAITGMKTDGDPPGATFAKLRLKSTKQTKTSIALKWISVKGAKQYIVYGNACGNANKPKQLAKTTGTAKTFSAVAGKKLKKGTYYKFVVVALDAKGNVVSVSKLIHVATTGGKVGNHKKVKVKKSVTKKAKKLKVGKTLKLKAKAVKKKKKVKKHAKVRYESTNTRIATVTSGGKVTAKKRGTCYIYAYAQNGVFKRIKIVVK